MSCNRSPHGLTVTPPPSTPEERRQVEALNEAFDGMEADTQVSVTVAGCEPIPVPAPVGEAIRHILNILAKGNVAVIEEAEPRLNEYEAADALNVPVATLRKLLDSAELEGETVGRHTFVSLEDLVAYDERRHEKAMRLLDGLTAGEDPMATLDNPLIRH